MFIEILPILAYGQLQNRSKQLKVCHSGMILAGIYRYIAVDSRLKHSGMTISSVYCDVSFYYILNNGAYLT
jgi:hypothetical protein